jgi:hypothetical protein
MQHTRALRSRQTRPAAPRAAARPARCRRAARGATGDGHAHQGAHVAVGRPAPRRGVHACARRRRAARRRAAAPRRTPCARLPAGLLRPVPAPTRRPRLPNPAPTPAPRAPPPPAAAPVRAELQATPPAPSPADAAAASPFVQEPLPEAPATAASATSRCPVLSALSPPPAASVPWFRRMMQFTNPPKFQEALLAGGAPVVSTPAQMGFPAMVVPAQADLIRNVRAGRAVGQERSGSAVAAAAAAWLGASKPGSSPPAADAAAPRASLNPPLPPAPPPPPEPQLMAREGDIANLMPTLSLGNLIDSSKTGSMNQEAHKNFRAMLQPAFTPEAINGAFLPEVVAIVERALAAWAARGEAVPGYDAFKRMTFEIIMQVGGMGAEQWGGEWGWGGDGALAAAHDGTS